MSGTTKLGWFIVGVLVLYDLLKLTKKNGWLPKGEKGAKLTTHEKRTFAIIATIAVAAAAGPLGLIQTSSGDSPAVQACIQATKDTSNDHSLDWLPGASVADTNRAAAAFCRSTGGIPSTDTTDATETATSP